jgi:D-inositol-3-phosphate glycosyltransferase
VKIAQLSTRFFPAPGGVERHVLEISKRMAGRGHAVTELTSDLSREYPMERFPPSVPRTDSVSGVRVRRLPVWSLPSELHYPFFRGLGAALAEEAPDVVHVHTYGTNHAAVARRFSRSHRTPYVLSAHYHPIWSMEGGAFRRRLRSFYDHQLAAPIVRDAGVLIVQTREEERLIRENGFPLPTVATIPPGYTPLPDPRPEDPPFGRSIGVEGPYVLFVGRLASNKGLLTLVRAFEVLARHDPSATLVLVGDDGGVRAAVEQEVARLGLGARVRFAGFLTDEGRLSAAFRDARLFVLPSDYESFGLVLLEALAQGTPVIASRVGGIPEFIPDGSAGRLVPPGDSAALAAALLELWDDEPRRKAWGAFGRDQVVPKYTWDRVVDRLLEVYTEVRRG